MAPTEPHETHRRAAHASYVSIRRRASTRRKDASSHRQRAEATSASLTPTTWGQWWPAEGAASRRGRDAATDRPTGEVQHRGGPTQAARVGWASLGRLPPSLPAKNRNAKAEEKPGGVTLTAMVPPTSRGAATAKGDRCSRVRVRVVATACVLWRHGNRAPGAMASSTSSTFPLRARSWRRCARRPRPR